MPTPIGFYGQTFLQAAIAEDMERQLNTLLASTGPFSQAILGGGGSGAEFVITMVADSTLPVPNKRTAYVFQGSDAGALQREFKAAYSRAFAEDNTADVLLVFHAGSSDGHSFMGGFITQATT
jgi:hypothetical protein